MLGEVVVAEVYDAAQVELAALHEENERLKSESFEGLYNDAIGERDALREELAEYHISGLEASEQILDLTGRLTAAEQRNSELVEWCAKKCEERAAYYEAGDDDAPGSRRAGACQNCADVIRWNKPTESGASE